MTYYLIVRTFRGRGQYYDAGAGAWRPHAAESTPYRSAYVAGCVAMVLGGSVIPIPSREAVR